MEKYTNLLLPILLDTAMALAAVAAVIGLITSLWLLLFPNSFSALEEKASRSFSFRRTLRPLEISRNIDRHIYRHHKLFGLLVIIASTFTIYRVLFDIMPSRIDTLVASQFPVIVTDWILSAMNAFLLIGNLFAIIIGFVIYVRPSALKGFEAHANRWVTLRKQTRWLETSIGFPDQIARTQPRILGIVLLIFSIYLISLLSMI